MTWCASPQPAWRAGAWRPRRRRRWTSCCWLRWGATRWRLCACAAPTWTPGSTRTRPTCWLPRARRRKNCCTARCRGGTGARWRSGTGWSTRAPAAPAQRCCTWPASTWPRRGRTERRRWTRRCGARAAAAAGAGSGRRCGRTRWRCATGRAARRRPSAWPQAGAPRRGARWAARCSGMSAGGWA